MTQEEKFNEAQRLYKTANADQKYVLERLFPELKELGDEMIRKAIRYAIGQSTHSDGTLINGVSSEEALAYLEKQGEQNNAWSEEDEMFVYGLIRGLSAKRDIHGHTTFSSDCIDITETIAWLESLKDRVQPQPKQEWSEEDEKMLNQIISIIENADDDLIRTENVSIYTNWLKSKIQPQLKWKPSNEQIGCLSDAIKHYNSLGYPASKLKELLDDLNKLMK